MERERVDPAMAVGAMSDRRRRSAGKRSLKRLPERMLGPD